MDVFIRGNSSACWSHLFWSPDLHTHLLTCSQSPRQLVSTSVAASSPFWHSSDSTQWRRIRSENRKWNRTASKSGKMEMSLIHVDSDFSLFNELETFWHNSVCFHAHMRWAAVSARSDFCHCPSATEPGENRRIRSACYETHQTS